MGRVVAVPSVINDVYRLVAKLRDADRAEVVAMGCDPSRILRSNFRGAFLRTTAFVDGEIAAMWGLYGSALSDVGYPYLLTANAVERVPIAVVKEGIKAVDQMLSVRRRLEGRVAASYDKACRLLECLGFELDDAKPFGPQDVLFRRFSISAER